MGKCQDLAKWETFASHRPKAAPGGAGTVLGKMWAVGESPREQQPPVKQPLEAGKLENKQPELLLFPVTLEFLLLCCSSL